MLVLDLLLDFEPAFDEDFLGSINAIYKEYAPANNANPAPIILTNGPKLLIIYPILDITSKSSDN